MAVRVLYVLSLLACGCLAGAQDGGITEEAASGSAPSSLWSDGAPEDVCDDLRPLSPHNVSDGPGPFMIDLSSFISSDTDDSLFMYVPGEKYESKFKL